MKYAFAAICLFAMVACSGFINNQAASSTYRILEKSQTAARRQGDFELARAAMPSGIMQLETFALAYPDHRGFKVLHADAVCGYAVGFVFDDWEDALLAGRSEEADRLAARVTQLATTCIEANLTLLPPAWRDARRKGGAAWDAIVGRVGLEQVPHLLWIATADATLLAIAPMQNAGKLNAIMHALASCIARRPGFHDSDGELLLGLLESGRSQFLGGPDGSATFAKARTQRGRGALLVEVMFARGTLVAKRDRAQFTATLQRVLAANVAQWPEQRLSNELARRKAQRYLAAIDALMK